MGAYDAMKLAAMLSFQRKVGCNEQEAARASMALHPLESSHRPVDRQLEKDIRKVSRRFAKASRSVRTSAELGELAYVALSRYAVMARVSSFYSGDEYYTDLFTGASLEAMVDMSPERLEELEAKL